MEKELQERYLDMYVDLNRAFLKEVEAGTSWDDLQPLLTEMRTISEYLKELPKQAIIRHMNEEDIENRQAHL